MHSNYTPEQREQAFWAKVDKDGPVPAYAPHLGPCWIWKASKTSTGYGQYFDGVRPLGAHRWAYRHFVGPVPVGLHLDHLCRVRHCVNPAHLEPVTCRENIMRGTGASARAAAATHCPQGHPYDDANTYRPSASGNRICRTCHREHAARSYHAAHPDAPTLRDMREAAACRHGHPWIAENIRITKAGKRQCTGCERERYRAKLKP